MSLNPNDKSHVETLVILEKGVFDYIHMKTETTFNLLDDLKLEIIRGALRTKFEMQEAQMVEYFADDAKKKQCKLDGIYLKNVIVKMTLRNFWNDAMQSIEIRDGTIGGASFKLAKELQTYIKPQMHNNSGWYTDINKWNVDSITIQTQWEGKSRHEKLQLPPLKKTKYETPS